MINKRENELIGYLLDYAVEQELICSEDRSFYRNKMLTFFKCDKQDIKNTDAHQLLLYEILDELCDLAEERKIIPKDRIDHRDHLDTCLMGILTPPPSQVEDKFRIIKRSQGIRAATDWYYKFSCSTNYIRVNRIKRDKKWVFPSKYGNLQISINLSKPEKDPKAIAEMKIVQQREYPKCLLCKENVGYHGDLAYPARDNHRIVSLSLCEEPWFLQYSPYVYYPQHCIVIHKDHHPMVINKNTVEKCLDFIEQVPHYFVGSNADLPIVGGSILAHEHFQGGMHHFPIEDASVFYRSSENGITVELLEWPLSVIRLRSDKKEILVEAFEHYCNVWKKYSDPSLEILAATEQPHNTITPIARRRGEMYELDLVLRNNRQSKEYPDGIFHPHAELHNIKKENIGLIEVMGLAVLPGRLNKEMALLIPYVQGKKNMNNLPEGLEKHREFTERCSKEVRTCQLSADEIIHSEMGRVFEQVLTHCGVFKQDEMGRAGFIKFVTSIDIIR